MSTRSLAPRARRPRRRSAGSPTPASPSKRCGGRPRAARRRPTPCARTRPARRAGRRRGSTRPAAPAPATPTPADHRHAVWRAWWPADSSTSPRGVDLARRAPTPRARARRRACASRCTARRAARRPRPAPRRRRSSSSTPGTSHARRASTTDPARAAQRALVQRRAPSHTAHHARGAGPIRATAAHSISSGPNAPTHVQRFSGRPPRQQRHALRRQRQLGPPGPGPRHALTVAACADDMLRRGLTDESIRGEGRTSVRAAAVQLHSTADRERNLATADRLTARPPRRAPSSSCCPRSGRCSARRSRRPPRAPSRSTAPSLHVGARDRARARHRPRRRLDRRARRRAPSAARNTSVHVGPDGEAAGASTARSTCSTSRSAGASTASPSTRRRATRSCVSETAGGVELGPDASVTTCASPSSTGSSPCAARACSPCRPRSRSPRRATTGRSCCAPARSRTRRSWSPPTRSASTRRAIRSGGRSMIVDPWGVVLAQAPDTRDVRRRRARPRAPGRDPPHAAVAGQPPARGLPLAERGARLVAADASPPSTSGG